MPDALDDFFGEHAELEWGWGSVDCCLALADWVVANEHSDPAAAWRGSYSDELTWRRIVTARGGLLPLVSDVCARAGLARAAVAARGVIGVIGSSRHPDRQWGAIHDGEHWQVRSNEGFSPMVAPVLGMWSI